MSDLTSYVQSFLPDVSNISSSCACPKCSAIDNFAPHATYNRNISFVINESIESVVVSITRVICKSCGSTHALLPNFIVPFKIHSSNSIISIVRYALKFSILKAAKFFCISFQTIYAFKILILTLFNNIHLLNNYGSTEYTVDIFISNYLKYSNPTFRLEFFEYFKQVFLISKFQNTIYRIFYFGISK